MNRSEFLSTLLRLSRPVLAAGAQGALRETMTVEGHPEANMRPYTCFEAAGRLLCGIAPWLEHEAVDPIEAEEQHRARELARGLMSAQLDPASPDYGNFEKLLRPHCQNLVDAAFLALGVLRAPRELGEKLDARTRDHLVRVLRLTREIRPPENNWLLFSATIEAALKLLTGSYDNLRIDYAYRQFEAWYVGDGLYNDGRSFSLDYYNSFVIQPMLLELCGMFPELIAPEAAARTLARARRYGALLERAVARLPLRRISSARVPRTAGAAAGSSAAGAGARRARGGDRKDTRRECVPTGRVSADRPLRQSAGAGGVLHLDRESLSGLDRVSAARSRERGPVLDRSGRAVDAETDLERRKPPRRSSA